MGNSDSKPKDSKGKKKDDKYFAMMARNRIKNQEKHEKEAAMRGRAYDQLKKKDEKLQKDL